MNMPSKISTWLMIVFFLLFGLAIVVALPPILIEIVALATAVLLFLDK